MTPEVWQIVAVVGIAVVLIAVFAWLALRSRRRASLGSHTHHNNLASLRSDTENLRDRSRILEERFDRYDHTTAELRDVVAKLREDLESRLSRISSHDDVQKSLQEQIFEIRKEHQILMERDERHERRMNEVLEQIGNIRTEVSTHGNGHKVR